MKKALYIGTAAALIIPSLAFASINQSLRYGDHGAQVSELQEFLIADGDLAGAPTGNFYSLTLAAVKKYQAANNISPVSGFVGPLTRMAINVDLAQQLAESNVESSTTSDVKPSTTPVNQTTQIVTLPSGAIVQMDQNGQITKVLYTPQSVLIETATTTSQVVPQPPAAPAPSQARIEIVSEGNYLYHLDSPHCIAPASVPTWDATTADCQLVELGAFVYDAQGNVLKGVDLIASTTDPAQNRVIHGTGIGDGHYQYNFLVRAQTNIVQFIANGVSASITMIAQ